MRRHVASALLVTAGAFVAACGDVYVDPFTNGQNPPPNDIPPGNVPIEPPFEPTRCPAKMPAVNTPCELPGSVCEYGVSADKNCNILLRCAGNSSNSYWMRSSVGDAARDALCRPSVCPSGDVKPGDPCKLPESEAGTFSDSDELVCNFDNRVCACSTGPDRAAPGEGRRWLCGQPTADCPDQRPLIGQPCPSNRLFCDYGACDYKSGMVMECQSGTWAAGGQEACK